MKQTPSSDRFIVHLGTANKETVLPRLADLGHVEEISDSDEMFLLRIEEGTSDAKEIWERARDVVGPDGFVEPVLYDERGNPHYPTGEVSVRFYEPLSDEQLRRFAADNRLRLRNRNEFVPEQAVFTPLTPDEIYIPDLLERIANSEVAKIVWANTLSRFQRARGTAKDLKAV